MASASALPRERRAGSTDRVGAAARGRSHARGARLPLRARPRVRGCRPRVRRDPGRAVRLCPRARRSVRRGAARAQLARPPGVDRRAARALARAGRGAAHARRPGRPRARRPVRDRPRVRRGDAPARRRQRGSQSAGGGARDGALPPALGSDTPVAVAIRTGAPQVVASTENLPDTRLPQPRAPSRGADGGHPHDAVRADDRARADARRAHVRVAEPQRPGSRSDAAVRADRAPRGPRSREQRALPGSARRARAAGGADAPAAARSDHRRDVLAQAAVHQPARAGAARHGRVRALDRRAARGAHPPGARRRVGLRRRDRRDPRRRHARTRVGQRRAGARRRRRDRRGRRHALRPDRAPPARGSPRVPGRGQRGADPDARPAAHALGARGARGAAARRLVHDRHARPRRDPHHGRRAR